MASEQTTSANESSTSDTNTIGFRPIDWWADRDLGIDVEPPRRTPPIPAFVQLSRLINADQVSAPCQTDHNVGPAIAPGEDIAGPPAPIPDPADRKRWADSVGRPLFQIGLAAIVAAILVGVLTFRHDGAEIATVELSEAAVTPDPGPGGHGLIVDPFISLDPAAEDEQIREVLEALVRQQSGDGEADLTIVGTTSAERAEVRWTATVRNNGPETAEGPITVVQTVGSDVELVSIAGDGWECDDRSTAGTITCTGLDSYHRTEPLGRLPYAKRKER